MKQESQIVLPVSIQRSNPQGKVFMHDGAGAWLGDVNSRLAQEIATKLNAWETLNTIAKAAAAASEAISRLRALARPEDMSLADPGDCDAIFDNLKEAVSHAEKVTMS